MLELFHHPGFVSLASLIALEEAGAAYTSTVVDFANGGNRTPSYLAINPYGQVPALRLPSGDVLTETLAIMCYVAKEYSAAALAPSDPLRYAHWVAVMARMASTYHPTFTLVVRPDMIVDDPAAQAEVQTAARARYANHLAELDRQFRSTEWIMGDVFSLADAHALVFHEWGARANFAMGDYLHLTQWYQRMLARPAVARALAEGCRGPATTDGPETPTPK